MLSQGMEGGLEKIQTLEDSMVSSRVERTGIDQKQAPLFTIPLANVDDLREGENAHFEARVVPTDDPKLKVCVLFFLYLNFSFSILEH